MKILFADLKIVHGVGRRDGRTDGRTDIRTYGLGEPNGLIFTISSYELPKHFYCVIQCVFVSL
jgi:hypothetical protein